MELCVVIGKQARHLSKEQAFDSIFGYTIMLDVTARGYGLSKNLSGTRNVRKGFETFAPIGPWITTGLDVSDLEVRCEVGRNPEEMEVRQLGRTKDMVFDVPALVSYISHVMTLLPGDVVLTGTPAGVSPLTDGDTVTVRIEGIGELTNPVVPVG